MGPELSFRGPSVTLGVGDRQRIEIAGHRGAAGIAPENTLPSFEAAWAAGVAWVETDVRLTGDGVPVLLHDATLDRTTTGQGAVSALTWDALRRPAGQYLDREYGGAGEAGDRCRRGRDHHRFPGHGATDHRTRRLTASALWSAEACFRFLAGLAKQQRLGRPDQRSGLSLTEPGHASPLVRSLRLL